MASYAKKYIIYLENDAAALYDGNMSISTHLQREYIMRERRRMMRTVYTARNSSFCKKHGINPTHSSRYCGCIIAQLEDSKVEKIKEDSEVMAVYEFENKRLVPMQNDIVSRQIRTDSITGSHSENFDGRSNGYLGDYVTLGAVSAQNLTYIPESYQLRVPQADGRLITVSPQNAELRESEHSSVVASIIVGGRAQSDGVIYRGAAPLSRLYIAPSWGVESMLEAMERCLDNGAVIINYSAGEYFSDGRYDEFDRLVDTLIYSARFLFVVSAGNSKYVSSPGTCVNGVTVGNAETKINGYRAAQRPYKMFFVSDDDCSAYEHDNVLPSKPDIAAPGTYIHYIDSYGNIDFLRYGTSFSAPYVSAVAAQLVQKYPSVSINPALLKALVLCGANGEAVSAENNPQYGSNNILRLKSGAGFLDSAESLETENRLGGSISDKRKMKIEILLNYGQRIRAVLCYLRNPDMRLFSSEKDNIILELISPTGEVVAVSDNEKENVKLIEHVADINGRYILSFGAISFGSSDSVSYGVSWRIY